MLNFKFQGLKICISYNTKQGYTRKIKFVSSFMPNNIEHTVYTVIYIYFNHDLGEYSRLEGVS